MGGLYPGTLASASGLRAYAYLRGGWWLTALAVLSLLAPAAQAQTRPEPPLLKLAIRGAATTLTDTTIVYEQDDSTTGYDVEYDAVKLPNSDGMNLASLTQDGQRLATNALPLPSLIAPLTADLFIGVPQDDQYTLVVAKSTLSSVKAYLLDAEQQTRQLLVPGFTFSFPLTKTNTGGTYISNSRFSLVFENITPLPVTLVAFTAQAQEGSGLLEWTTASEQQNAYFQVESSLDGTTFTALGRVAGAGTSPTRHTYQFRDADLARYAAPQVYYRLRQVDTDGTSVFSPVRSLSVPAAGLAVTAIPTALPAGQALHLLVRTATACPAWLRITDMQGRYLGQRALALPAGASTIALPEAGQWAPGLYFVRVQQGVR